MIVIRTREWLLFFYRFGCVAVVVNDGNNNGQRLRDRDTVPTYIMQRK